MIMLLKLFFAFLQIGLFSFGGGYATIPLIQSQIVTVNQWLTMEQLVDVITISQMTPGPIAINAATFVGSKIAGVPGSIAATLGVITPSIIICLFLAFIYYRYKNLSIVKGILSGLRPAIVAFIASAGLSIVQTAVFKDAAGGGSSTDINVIGTLLFVACFILLRTNKKIDPIMIMVGAGFVNLGITFGMRLVGG